MDGAAQERLPFQCTETFIRIRLIWFIHRLIQYLS